MFTNQMITDSILLLATGETDEWAVCGVWQDIFATLAASGGPPAEALIDSTHVKVHRTAGGAFEHSEGLEQCIGRSRVGSNTKIHMIVDAQGRPRVLALSAGNTHDIKPAAAMLTAARPTVRVLADKAYDSAELQRRLAAQNVKAIIPNRRNRKQPFSFDTRIYTL